MAFRAWLALHVQQYVIACLIRLVMAQEFLQQFAWMEAEKDDEIAKRNRAAVESIMHEPLFCFETAIKLLYWSNLVYYTDMVRHVCIAKNTQTKKFPPDLSVMHAAGLQSRCPHASCHVAPQGNLAGMHTCNDIFAQLNMHGGVRFARARQGTRRGALLGAKP